MFPGNTFQLHTILDPKLKGCPAQLVSYQSSTRVDTEAVLAQDSGVKWPIHSFSTIYMLQACKRLLKWFSHALCGRVGSSNGLKMAQVQLEANCNMGRIMVTLLLACSCRKVVISWFRAVSAPVNILVAKWIQYLNKSQILIQPVLFKSYSTRTEMAAKMPPGVQCNLKLTFLTQK